MEELKLILKGDVSGSVEALEDALVKLDVGEDVSLRVIHRGVGAITENDVTLASASDAVIIGFQRPPRGQVPGTGGARERRRALLQRDLPGHRRRRGCAEGHALPEFEEAQLGTAEIREVYRLSKFGNIAGCLSAVR